MKRRLFFMIALIAVSGFVNAQQRSIARGAVPSELYVENIWYGIYNPAWGPPVVDTMLRAIIHITDHGKTTKINYAEDTFIHTIDVPHYDTTKMVPYWIISDATPGVIYNKGSRYSYTLGYWVQSFWVSFDYGKSWTFREEERSTIYYYPSDFGGLIYRGESIGYDKRISKSHDYGNNWLQIGEQGFMYISECGFDSCELFGITGSSPDPWKLYHTYDWYDTYTSTSIDHQYIFGNMSGAFPDVYRGALPGEVYVSSWFPDWTYKISFSADTGQSFRVVYHSDSINFWGDDCEDLRFIPDREAGVFYIARNKLVEIDEYPDGDWWFYTQLCISHYRDYGETLVGTYCHDLMMHYPDCCAGVLDMEAEVVNNNVALQWSIPEAESPPKAYRIYRNDTLLKELPQTAYLDENLPNGSYTYAVRAVYADGCESLSYNTVKVAIDVTGIGEKEKGDGIVVFPNPTGGKIQVTAGANNYSPIQNIEVFDVFGRNMDIKFPSFGGVRGGNISHLPTGMYFLRITTGNGVVTRKVVKM